MQSLANKWKALLQTQSNQQIKLSKSGTNRKEEQNKSKYKQSLIDQYSYHKKSKQRLDLTKQQKNRNSKTISIQKRKISNTKQKQTIQNILDTPSKLNNKRNDKIIDRYTNAIVQLLQENQANRLRSKIKALINDMSAHIESQGMMASSVRVGVGDRAYHQLQLKYFESQKQRQYLKGKIQMSAKRYQGLQRQLQRYNKIEKLIDSSIFRQNELRQEINKLKTEKAFLQSQMLQQKQMFCKQVDIIRQLIDSLKVHLPIN